MQLQEIKTTNDIQRGDTIIVTGDMYDKQPFKVPKVKVSESDGVEVILNMKKNHFFNLGMYLDGSSWVKEVRKVID